MARRRSHGDASVGLLITGINGPSTTPDVHRAGQATHPGGDVPPLQTCTSKSCLPIAGRRFLSRVPGAQSAIPPSIVRLEPVM